MGREETRISGWSYIEPSRKGPGKVLTYLTAKGKNHIPLNETYGAEEFMFCSYAEDTKIFNISWLDAFDNILREEWETVLRLSSPVAETPDGKFISLSRNINHVGKWVKYPLDKLIRLRRKQ